MTRNRCLWIEEFVETLCAWKSSLTCRMICSGLTVLSGNRRLLHVLMIPSPCLAGRNRRSCRDTLSGLRTCRRESFADVVAVEWVLIWEVPIKWGESKDAFLSWDAEVAGCECNIAAGAAATVSDSLTKGSDFAKVRNWFFIEDQLSEIPEVEVALRDAEISPASISTDFESGDGAANGEEKFVLRNSLWSTMLALSKFKELKTTLRNAFLVQ